jgi:hypothetical protein
VTRAARNSESRPLLRALPQGGAHRKGGNQSEQNHQQDRQHGQRLPGIGRVRDQRLGRGRDGRPGVRDGGSGRDVHDRQDQRRIPRQPADRSDRSRSDRRGRSRRGVRSKAPQESLIRLRGVFVAGVAAVSIITVVAPATASALPTAYARDGNQWVEITTGIWEETNSGRRVILRSDGSIAAILSKSQVEHEKRGLEAIANASGGNGPSSDVQKAVVNDVPGETQAEAKDSANVLTKVWKREGLTEPAEKWMTKLAEDEGGMLTGAQMAGILGVAVGGITLGPTAFKLGVDLGNGLDEFLGFPKWEVYEKEESPKAAGYSLAYCKYPETLDAEGATVQYQCPGSGAGGLVGGTYVTYREGAIAVKNEWPETGEKHTFVGTQGFKGIEQTGEKIYGSYPKRYVVHAWFYMVCAGNALPIAFGGTGTCALPEGVTGPGQAELPVEGPFGEAQEAENKAHKVPAHPVHAPPHINREPHLTKQQEAKKFWEEQEGKPAPKTPEQFKEETLPESEEGHENRPMPESELEPGPAFVTKNSPESETNPENEPEAEPSPSPSGGPPTVPPIRWPSVPSPCTVFPFGVPCWFVERLEEWSRTARAPSFTLKVAGVDWTVDASHAEAFMVIIRVVEGVLTAIGIVLLFGRFAGSSSQSSDGGGGGD